MKLHPERATCHPERSEGSAFLHCRRGLPAFAISIAAAILMLLPLLGRAQNLQLAITVDDLPSHGPLPPGITRQQIAQSFLDTFQREHLPPIYGFINGGRGQSGDASVLTMWHNAGEPLGNHTWSHWNLTRISSELFLSEVDKNGELLDQIDPRGDTKWLRYPYLHEGDTVAKRRAVRAGLFARGYRIAEVTMDFEDYLWNDPYARCSAKNDPESLKYLHDSYLETADHYVDVYRRLSQQAFHRNVPYVLLMHIGAFDAKMLPELIALYRRRGFTFVTMPHALEDKAYKLDPDIGDKDGGSFTELLLEARHETVAPDTKPYETLDKLCR